VSLSKPRIAAALVLAALAVSLRAADEGWIIERLHSRYEIQPDGSLDVLENIDVDFRGLSRHGIFPVAWWWAP
jgi:hypothetical protein